MQHGGSLAIGDAESFCDILLSSVYSSCVARGLKPQPFYDSCVARSCASGLLSDGCKVIQSFEAACSASGGVFTSAVDACGVCRGNGGGAACSNTSRCQLFGSNGLLSPGGDNRELNEGCEYVIAVDCSSDALYSVHYFRSATTTWISINAAGVLPILINSKLLIVVDGQLFQSTTPYLPSGGRLPHDGRRHRGAPALQPADGPPGHVWRRGRAHLQRSAAVRPLQHRRLCIPEQHCLTARHGRSQERALPELGAVGLL